MNEKAIKILMERIEKLERAVFADDGKEVFYQPKTGSEYTGATGGIRLLVDKGVFTSKLRLSDVKAELAKRGYHYSVQALQMGLNRLSRSSGPLVTFKENGKKVYVQRK